MSASSKKKLRSEQENGKLTERQIAEQKEAKKLKLYTTAFVVVLVALLVVALTVGISQTVKNSGIREKNTVAMTLENTDGTAIEVNSDAMAYHFIDYIQQYANQNSYFLAYMLDTTKPLDEQIYNDETGETWADFFVDGASSSARSVYALCAAAEAAGHTLTETEQASIDSVSNNMQLYSQLYGFSSADAYLKAMYGNGASLESYVEYVTKTTLANSYYTAYGNSLSFDDAALRAAEADNFHEFSSFNYNSYYMATSQFRQGGTENEDGTVTYSDEENAAAEEAIIAAAKELTESEEITTLGQLDLAISALSINAEAENPVNSTAYEDQPYANIDADVAAWLADNRTEGDIGAIPRKTTDAETGEETITGYYIVYFTSINDNAFPLVNVRHLLVSFEGGTTDENGSTVYSDDEKAAAKAKAEELLAQWEAGDKTEESFAALANEHSTDTGSNTNGGLYENVYPGQMVEPFENWCFDSRKAGETGIVETTYGYHIMFFSGNSEQTYRDFMITNKLTNTEMDLWFTALVEAYTIKEGNEKYLPKDFVLSNG